MILESKSYHHYFSSGRFSIVEICYKNDSLIIAYNGTDLIGDLKTIAFEFLQKMYSDIENLKSEDSKFFKQLKGSRSSVNSELANQLSDVSVAMNIGPEAMLKPLICEKLGAFLLADESINELVVHDGKNLFVQLTDPLKIPLLLGDHPMTGLVGYSVYPKDCPLVIGNSDSMKGSLMHYGKADQVLAFSKDGTFAGALATALFNRIKKPEDVQRQLDQLRSNDLIHDVLIIMDDYTGIYNDLEIGLLND